MNWRRQADRVGRSGTAADEPVLPYAAMINRDDSGVGAEQGGHEPLMLDVGVRLDRRVTHDRTSRPNDVGEGADRERRTECSVTQ